MEKITPFQRLAKSSEALRLELQDFHERDARYKAEFNRDFSKEIQFLRHKAGAPKKNYIKPEEKLAPPKIPAGPKVSPKLMKQMHRKLAKLTHPDHHGEEREDEFLEIQDAYEKGNGTALLAAAARHDAAIDLREEEIAMLEKQLDTQRMHLMSQKQASLHWAWAQSDKSENMRIMIRQAIGIRHDEFVTWVSSSGTATPKKSRDELEYEKKMRRMAERRRLAREKNKD